MIMERTCKAYIHLQIKDRSISVKYFHMQVPEKYGKMYSLSRHYENK